MSAVIVSNGINVDEAASDLQGLGFSVRRVQVNDCSADDPRTDFYLIPAKSPSQTNELLEQLSAIILPESPKMVLTGKDDLSKINLNLVDDFIAVPFDPLEAAFRLRYQLEKNGVTFGEILKVDGLILSSDNYEVTVEGRLIELTFREFELLRFLMSNSGRVFSRPQLMERIWQYDYFSGTRTVDVHVRRLRAKLGPKYGYRIQTVRNVGYRFGRK